MAKIPINISSGEVEKQKEVIVGIDLGTTHSLISYIKDDLPIVLKDRSGDHTIVPSVIYFDEHGEHIIGEKARTMSSRHPERTIFSVKRLMGKSYKDLVSFKEFFGYKIIESDDDSLVKIAVDNKFYSPIELSSLILRELKSVAENQLGEKISKCVITVPAYFNDSQRQATRDAGKLAGLDVLRIINEPTAASLAYGLGVDPDVQKTIAVYDLGGGTFDISILNIDNQVFEVLSTNGDTFLGGDDFDRAIVTHWINELQLKEKQISPNLMQSLRLEAETAKKALSDEDQYKGNLEGHPLMLSRDSFNDLIRPLVDRTLKACDRALRDANLDIEDIDEIILVGGSTRVPFVTASVETFFNKQALSHLNPDEVVAQGAAVHADILGGNRRDMLLLDITPLSLGIETVGGLMDVIVPRNSKIPSSTGRQYTTSVDGQKNLKIAVYQGERDLVEDNRKLGEFILTNIPPMPAGLPKIEIHFIIDTDGILKVKAKELRSEVEQEIIIRSQYGISEEEMARMLLDAMENAEDDMKIKALKEAENEANNILLASKKFIEQNSQILSDEQIDEINSLCQEIRDNISKRDKDGIQSAIENLNEYTRPLAHQALESVISSSLRGKSLEDED